MHGTDLQRVDVQESFCREDNTIKTVSPPLSELCVFHGKEEIFLMPSQLRVLEPPTRNFQYLFLYINIVAYGFQITEILLTIIALRLQYGQYR
jgi:hypothetical protein